MLRIVLEVRPCLVAMDSRAIVPLDLLHNGVHQVHLPCSNQGMGINNQHLTPVHLSNICLSHMVGIPNNPQLIMLLDGIRGLLHLVHQCNSLEVMITMDNKARLVQVQLMETMAMGSPRLVVMGKEAHMVSRGIPNKAMGNRPIRIKAHHSRDMDNRQMHSKDMTSKSTVIQVMVPQELHNLQLLNKMDLHRKDMEHPKFRQIKGLHHKGRVSQLHLSRVTANQHLLFLAIRNKELHSLDMDSKQHLNLLMGSNLSHSQDMCNRYLLNQAMGNKHQPNLHTHSKGRHRQVMDHKALYRNMHSQAQLSLAMLSRIQHRQGMVSNSHHMLVMLSNMPLPNLLTCNMDPISKHMLRLDSKAMVSSPIMIRTAMGSHKMTILQIMDIHNHHTIQLKMMPLQIQVQVLRAVARLQLLKHLRLEVSL